MTAIVPEVPTTRTAPRIVLHVDEVLGVADVSVDGPVDPGSLAHVAATLSCRLHAAIERAATTVVVDLERAPGCDATAPAVARVLACARAGALARGLAFEIV